MLHLLQQAKVQFLHVVIDIGPRLIHILQNLHFLLKPLLSWLSPPYHRYASGDSKLSSPPLTIYSAWFLDVVYLGSAAAPPLNGDFYLNLARSFDSNCFLSYFEYCIYSELFGSFSFFEYFSNFRFFETFNYFGFSDCFNYREFFCHSEYPNCSECFFHSGYLIFEYLIRCKYFNY